MCGIAGLLPGTSETATAMATSLAHRGPDGAGSWSDGRVALGHRRLAVYDPTEAGAQPMTSADRRWTVVFNGAVYNHRSLRAELERRGHRFRGHADTEVLVEALAEWGVPGALPELNGMFAFGAWDAVEGRLWLARDRLGEKPLYYGDISGSFAFASELKAFRAVPGFRGGVDPAARAAFLRLGYVPAPLCIHPRLAKLPPGTYLLAGGEPTSYWSATAVAERPRDGGIDGVDGLHDLLLDAVDLRMQADVPVGAFLSGGVDSSLVVALMQARRPGAVRTFTAAFDDPCLDERSHARAVAEHLGTDHVELAVTADDCLDLVPRLPEVFDEPFADVSQVPLHLLAARARRHVTVALTGDGGDEVFGGYNRYAWLPRLARWPRVFRQPAGMALGRVGRDGRMRKLARVLAAPDLPAMRHAVTSVWSPAPVRNGAVSIEGLRWIDAEPAEQLMHLDALTYLPDNILTKVDRATMAVALEARVPFLDHRVFELAWRLPPPLRHGRAALREVLHRYVPRELVDRPKAGFDPPVATWLRGALRPWAEPLLAVDALAGSGLDPVPVRVAWDDHLRGRDRTYELWAVLMLQAWAA
jgi:asparagine synthase (glutamine-hydrolysing)